MYFCGSHYYVTAIMEEEIQKCVEILREGKILLYPTDTVWGIGCDATNEEAITRIYRIKQRNEKKSMIILLDSAERLPLYVEHIPLIAWDLISQVTRPTTFIYSTAQHLPNKLVHDDSTIAIRVANHEFCKKLIRAFGKPIVSTSANLAMQPTPQTFAEIAPEIKKQMDHIVPEAFANSVDYKPSRIIKFLDDYNFTVVRD